MSMIFNLTTEQWEELVQRMHGEGVMRPALYRDENGAIGMAGPQTSDLVLWLSHVAELVEDYGGIMMPAMQHLRYFADQVEHRDHTWWLPCVQAPKE